MSNECKIDSHVPTDNGEGCTCGYFAKKLDMKVFRDKVVEDTAEELLRRFNKAGEEDLNDVRILTNSDSWHVALKEIKAL